MGNKKVKPNINFQEYEKNYTINLKLLFDKEHRLPKTDFFFHPLTVFKSIYDKVILILSNINNSITAYDLNENKLISEIRNSHHYFISYFKHFLDKMNKRDIIMSLSCQDNNLKVWDAYNWENILNIQKVNNNGYLYSSCFLNINNDILIITSNWQDKKEIEGIKVFNLKGIKINEIKNSKEDIFCVESYYDIRLSKNFIITGNLYYVKSYDFDENKLYYIYKEKRNNYHHHDIILKSNENIIKLIESSYDGFIRIWHFNSNLLLNKIEVSYSPGDFYYICLWNNDYLFVGYNKAIFLFNLKDGLNIRVRYKGFSHNLQFIHSIRLPKFGDCLINLNDNKIELFDIDKEDTLNTEMIRKQ